MKSVASLGAVTALYDNSRRAVSVAEKADGTGQAVPALPATHKDVQKVKLPPAGKGPSALAHTADSRTPGTGRCC